MIQKRWWWWSTHDGHNREREREVADDSLSANVFFVSSKVERERFLYRHKKRPWNKDHRMKTSNHCEWGRWWCILPHPFLPHIPPFKTTRKAWMTTTKRWWCRDHFHYPKRNRNNHIRSSKQNTRRKTLTTFRETKKKDPQIISFSLFFLSFLLFPQNKSSHCSLLSSELSFFILVRHLLLFFLLVLLCFCNIFLSVSRFVLFPSSVFLLLSFSLLLSLHVICLPLDDDDSLVDLSVFVCPAHFFPSLSLPHPFRLRLTVRFGRRKRDRELTTQDWPSKKRGCSSPFRKKRKTPSKERKGHRPQTKED